MAPEPLVGRELLKLFALPKCQAAAIAAAAARLMAEDGIDDFATAKRKAARQAGVAEARELPDNDEIDAARASFQQLFHADEQNRRLLDLREQAVLAMRELADFDPHLTGSVLSGGAGKFAVIHLQLFTDDDKGVEILLLGRGIKFSAGQSIYHTGDARITVPTYTLHEGGDAEIQLAVFSRRELRTTLKTSPNGKTIERARLAEVEMLLADNELKQNP